MVYTLLIRLLPLRLIFGVGLILISTQLLGVDLVGPIADWLVQQTGLSFGSLWDNLPF